MNIFLQRTFLILLFFLIGASSFAQKTSLSGTVQDNADQSPLIGVTLLLIEKDDTTRWIGASSNAEGSFRFNNVVPGAYILRATYIGYNTVEKTLSVTATAPGPITLVMEQATTLLKGVDINKMRTRAQQRGDTVQYNSDAFKTNPDASAQDLITKMPGVTTENGTVKVGGEDVRRILVDGKPFFGDDPNLALKNLPAEIIAQIQVFDQGSEQAQFTGFDDGNNLKTINIITRPGKSGGQFGRVYAGLGPDGYYSSGGNINSFKGDRRISLVGISNNINQQNFSNEDLAGITAGGGGNRGGGGRRGGGPGGNRGGGNDAGNFLTGPQGGIVSTHAFGVNYSDVWFKKVKITTSYFLNIAQRNQFTALNRTFFLAADSGLVYNERSETNSRNINNRANVRLEWTIDSSNSVIITPNINLQGNNSTAALTGSNIRFGEMPENSLLTRNTGNRQSYYISNNILYRHKMAKEGRTLSLNLGTSLNDNMARNRFFSRNENRIRRDTTILDQRNDLDTDGITLSTSINYTEPLSRKSQLQVTYNPSYNKNSSDQFTYDLEGTPSLNQSLSNSFGNTFFTNRGGVSYRYNDKKLSLMSGLNVQRATLSGNQVYPGNFTISKVFVNLLPSAMLNYKFSQTSNLRIFYRTSTDAPNVNQLQNVPNISNPLFVSIGNPELKQSFQHRLVTRFGTTNTDKATSIFLFLFGSYEQDYISNSTIRVAADTTIGNGYVLNAGNQLIRPVNLDGLWNIRSFLTYGMPLTVLKSNLNLNIGATFARTPALLNNQLNNINTYNFSQGITLGSNISEQLDFTLSYTANYNIVRNQRVSESNNNYFVQNSSALLNWLFGKGFVMNTNLNHTSYSGLGEGFNQNFLLWNAAVGYRFLKDRALEVKLSVNDILNQNNSVNRTVTETFIDDTITNVLNRFFMVTLTYNIKRFNGTVPAPSEDNEGGFRHRNRP